jgi:sulfite exporter TauE/SafE
MIERGLIPLLGMTLIASLLGSWHCAGMCGGLVGAMSRTPAEQASYHAGRIVMYGVLGGLAGAITGIFLGADWAVLRWGAALFLGGSLIGMGLSRLISGRGVGPSLWVARRVGQWIQPLGRWARFHPVLGRVLLGGASAFLPCGWLYGFVVIAGTTGHVWSGVFVMLVFGLGTLPALHATSWVLGRIRRATKQKANMATALVMVAMGLMTLGLHFLPMPCH